MLFFRKLRELVITKSDYTNADITAPTLDKKLKQWQRNVGLTTEKPKITQAIGWTVLALLPLLFALFTIMGGWNYENNRQELLSILSNGERAVGDIISQKVWSDYEVGAGSYYYYLIEYTFTLPSGQETFGKYTFSDPHVRSIVDELDVGDRIEIAYDKQNPTLNLPVNAEPKVRDSAGAWLSLIITLLCSGLLAFFSCRKAWHLWNLSIHVILS